MPPTHGSVIELIDGFLKNANADLEKEAAANLDLAGDAKSTHPSANVDDKTKPATEGARSSENEADVRKEVPNTINDAASANSGGAEEGATVNGDQGTVTMSADSGLKGTVDTPKKDHSKSMSDSGPGDDTFKGDWDKASAAGSLVGEANALLADVAMLAGEKTQAQPPAQAGGEAQKSAADAGQSAADDEAAELFKKAAEQHPEDVEAGYVAAALLAQQMGLMKDAAGGEPTEEETVAQIQKTASDDGEHYVEFLRGFAETLEKSAQPVGVDPAALAALAGEGDAGGELGTEELAAGTGDTGAGEALGGPGGAEELAGAEEAGEAGEGDVLEQLSAFLEQAGISPEELAQAIAAQEAGGEEEAGETGEAAPEVV